MKSIQPALTTYFFGHQKDEKLTVEKFIRFQKQLQEEILRIEFHRYDLNADGTLKEVSKKRKHGGNDAFESTKSSSSSLHAAFTLVCRSVHLSVIFLFSHCCPVPMLNFLRDY